MISMELAIAMSATGKCVAVLLFTGVVAPLAGLLFRHVGAGWESIGKGPLAIEPEPRPDPDAPVDPEIVAIEVRQMLEAKADRRRRRADFIGSG